MGPNGFNKLAAGCLTFGLVVWLTGGGAAFLLVTLIGIGAVGKALLTT